MVHENKKEEGGILSAYRVRDCQTLENIKIDTAFLILKKKKNKSSIQQYVTSSCPYNRMLTKTATSGTV